MTSGSSNLLNIIAILLSGGIRIMIPIAFAALSCTLSERVGIVNIGAEGMMLIGAFGAVTGSFITGSAWMGLLFAIVCGMLLAAVHALLTIKFKTGQIISGLGINMLSLGLTTVLLQSIWGNRGKSAEVAGLGNIKLPFLKDVPLLGQMFQTISPMLIILLILTVCLWYWMNKTVAGLRARSIGENPRAADSVGINVSKMQYLCVIVSGGLAALGGAYLSIGDVSMFARDMVAGRGFIALAVTILGGWSPIGVVGGSLLFGVAQSIQFRLQQFDVPVQVVQMLPYVLTLLIMIFVRSSRAPAFSGKNFDREQLS